MDPKKRIRLSDLKDYEGQELGCSDWVRMTQAEITLFSHLGGDQQWIHTDRRKAAQLSPYGDTIAQGYFILALAPKLMAEIFDIEDAGLHLNLGFDRIRFLSPLKVDHRFRLRVKLTEASALLRLFSKEAFVDTKFDLTFEGEDSSKPICEAKLLKRWCAETEQFAKA